MACASLSIAVRRVSSSRLTVHVDLVQALVLLALVQRQELLVQARLASLVRARTLGPDPANAAASATRNVIKLDR